MALIQSIDLFVKTGTTSAANNPDEGPGTDDWVYLCIGGREFAVQSANSSDDFESGDAVTYTFGKKTVATTNPVKNSDQNDPRQMFAMDSDDLDLFPVWIRTEQHGDWKDWLLEDASITVFTNDPTITVKYTPVGQGDALWLGGAGDGDNPTGMYRFFKRVGVSPSGPFLKLDSANQTTVLTSVTKTGKLEVDAFFVTNVNGNAIEGDTKFGYGVVGVSQAVTSANHRINTAGVFGSSTVGSTGLGIDGHSPDGTGVRGTVGLPNVSNYLAPAGVGVYGESQIGVADTTHRGTAAGDSPYRIGVFGVSPDCIGVKGTCGGVIGETPVGVGVYGEADMATTGTGVAGYSPAGTGVRGMSGVDSPTLTSSGTGVYGEAKAAGAQGVLGYAPTGPGVEGDSKTGYGVKGVSKTVSSSSSAAGVRGESTVGSKGRGVVGYSPDGTGVRGTAGIDAASLPSTGVGVYGESNAAGGRGVVGYSPNGVGIYGRTSQAIGTAIGVYGTTPNLKGFAGAFRGTVGVIGGLFATVSNGLALPNPPTSANPNAPRLLLYSLVCPDSWLEDFGGGKLAAGKVTINISADFLKVIQTTSAGGFRVFVTPESDCKGLFIASKNATSFVVKELQSGTSNATFSYRLVARRKGTSPARLPLVGIPQPV